MVADAQRQCYLCLVGWCKTREEINGAKLDRGDEFCYDGSMTAPEQKEQKMRLLKAKIAVALQDETGKVPSKERIEEVFLLTRVMYNAVLGLHFKGKERLQSVASGPAGWGGDVLADHRVCDAMVRATARLGCRAGLLGPIRRRRNLA